MNSDTKYVFSNWIPLRKDCLSIWYKTKIGLSFLIGIFRCFLVLIYFIFYVPLFSGIFASWQINSRLFKYTFKLLAAIFSTHSLTHTHTRRHTNTRACAMFPMLEKIINVSCLLLFNYEILNFTEKIFLNYANVYYLLKQFIVFFVLNLILLLIFVSV